jgi:DNA repair protein RAD5
MLRNMKIVANHLTLDQQESDLLEVVRPKVEQECPGTTEEACQSAPEVQLRRNNFRSSTKLEALIQHLRKPLDLGREKL